MLEIINIHISKIVHMNQQRLFKLLITSSNNNYLQWKKDIKC